MSDTLTQKQEDFCLAYIETGNASEAYRRAYDADGMKDETVNRKAHDLTENGKIRARLDELRAPAVEAAQLTLEAHLASLERLRDVGEALGQIAAAVTAETNRGKAAGHYVERKELTGKDGSPLGEVPKIIVNFTRRKADLSVLTDDERQALESIARKLDVSEEDAVEAMR